jgi:hypothetical protein
VHSKRVFAIDAATNAKKKTGTKQNNKRLVCTKKVQKKILVDSWTKIDQNVIIIAGRN